MPDQRKLALWVDGSSYLFRAFYGLPPLTGPQGQATGAVYGVVNMLRSVLREKRPDYFAVVFDPPGKNFRHRLYPEYKAQRPPLADDLRSQIEPTFNLIKALGFPLLQISDCEADDVIATLTKRALDRGARVLIATGDKDMMQLVDEQTCLLDTMRKGGPRQIGVEQVKEKFGVMPNQIVDYLTLCGDKSDNIPGVRGVGPKTAAEWLNRYPTLERMLANSDKLKGKNAESLRRAADEIRLYRQLISLRQDIPLVRDFSSLKRSSADEETLKKLCRELGFVSWLSEMSPSAPSASDGEQKDKDYDLILTEKSLRRWLNKLRKAGRFAFSLNTDSSDYMTGSIIGFSFALPAQAAYVPVAHQALAYGQLDCQEVLRLLKPLLADPRLSKYGHNMKFIRNVLLNNGIELAGLIDDVALASYVHNAGACRHELDAMAARYLSPSSYPRLADAGQGKRKPAAQWSARSSGGLMADRMGAIHDLHSFFKKSLRSPPEHQRWYEEVEMPLLSVLSDMERKGVVVDKAVLGRQRDRLQEKITRLEEEIYKLAGHPFNIDSPNQVGQVLFVEKGLTAERKTATGKFSTDERVLEKLATKSDLARLILDCRAFKKLKSSFVDKLIKMIHPSTRRVHTSYQQAMTATGRLSSANPNLQNIPIRGEEGQLIRGAFVAPADHLIVSADYSQIELRIMAHLSGDQNMISAFKNNEDIHRTTAAEVFSVKSEQVSWEQRRFAKAINFGLIYGMGAYSLARQLGVERADAQSYYDAYFSHYPKVKDYMRRAKDQARKHGYVKTLFGRRLYTPDIKSRNFQRRQHAQRAAINAPMQGTAADIIKRAMVDLHGFLRRSDSAAMLIQVHDELVLEVPKSGLKKVEEECRARMMAAADLAAADLSVALAVEINSGPDWNFHGASRS